MDQEKNILSVEDIRYEIDRRELLKGISLEIPRAPLWASSVPTAAANPPC